MVKLINIQEVVIDLRPYPFVCVLIRSSAAQSKLCNGNSWYVQACTKLRTHCVHLGAKYTLSATLSYGQVQQRLDEGDHLDGVHPPQGGRIGRLVDGCWYPRIRLAALLQQVHLVVQPLKCQQLLVRSSLHNATVMQYQNQVRVLNGG